MSEGDAARVLSKALERGMLSAAEAHEARLRFSAEPHRRPQDILREVAHLDERSLAALDDASLVGHTLGGFKLLSKIGEGGMGSVFLATQTSLGRTVAVKVLDPLLSSRGDFAARFRLEAHAAAQLDHPNIVQPIDFGEDGGLLYFAMELMEGGSAASRLAKEGRLPEAKAIELGIAIARALEYAEEKRLVHRDVKPDNILFSKHGTAKLADLGLVVERGDSHHLTEPGLAMGTLEYMSPEQVRAQRDLDVRSDIYSLGASIFELTAGRRPFVGDDPLKIAVQHLSARAPDPRDLGAVMSDALAGVLARALEKRREDRYASARELREAFEAAEMGRLAIEAARIGSAAPLPEVSMPEAPAAPLPAARRPRAPAIVAALLLAALAAALLTPIRGRVLTFLHLKRGRAPSPLAADAKLGAPRPFVEIDAALRRRGSRAGTSAWGQDLDAGDEDAGPSIVGQGTGRLAVPLGAGPWRIEGRLRLHDAEEAGVRVDRADGGGVALTVRRREGGLVLGMGRLGPDEPSGEPRRMALLVPERVAPSDEIFFALVLEKGRVLVQAGSGPLGEAPLEGAPAGVSLYVVRAAGVQFQDLEIRAFEPK